MTIEKLTFCPVNRDNVVELLHLSVPDNEKHLISPCSKWLAQAPHAEESETYGIFHDETAVGLISIINPELASEEDRDHYRENHLYIWRLMIDHVHRRQGHGNTAIKFALQVAENKGRKGVSLTTKDKSPRNALPFYEKLGFEPTGRRLDDEIELIYKF